MYPCNCATMRKRFAKKRSTDMKRFRPWVKELCSFGKDDHGQPPGWGSKGGEDKKRCGEERKAREERGGPYDTIGMTGPVTMSRTTSPHCAKKRERTGEPTQ